MRVVSAMNFANVNNNGNTNNNNASNSNGVRPGFFVPNQNGEGDTILSLVQIRLFTTYILHRKEK